MQAPSGVVGPPLTPPTKGIVMIEGMQRGRHSPGYVNGRFSPYHEITTHEFQRRVANQVARSMPVAEAVFS